MSVNPVTGLKNGKFEIYLVPVFESICELNMGSLQKGDQLATLDAFDSVRQGDFLADLTVSLIQGKTPADQAILIRFVEDQ